MHALAAGTVLCLVVQYVTGQTPFILLPATSIAARHTRRRLSASCTDLPGELSGGEWQHPTLGTCADFEEANYGRIYGYHDIDFCAEYGYTDDNGEGRAGDKCCECGGGRTLSTGSITVDGLEHTAAFKTPPLSQRIPTVWLEDVVVDIVPASPRDACTPISSATGQLVVVEKGGGVLSAAEGQARPGRRSLRGSP